MNKETIAEILYKGFLLSGEGYNGEHKTPPFYDFANKYNNVIEEIIRRYELDNNQNEE